MMDMEWIVLQDNEAGPGWDWMVIVPGKENVTNLDEETARRIAADHNRLLRPRPHPTSTSERMSSSHHHLRSAGCHQPWPVVR